VGLTTPRLWHHAQPGSGGRPTVLGVRMLASDGHSVSILDPFFGLASRELPPLRTILNYPSDALDCDLLVLRDVAAEDFSRFGDSEDDLRRELLNRFGMPVRVASLAFADATDGRLPRLTLGGAGENERLGLERALRDLELNAKLIRTGAIRSAENAHFQLPSGSHAERFVRVADALDSHAAVCRVADWLQHQLTPDTILLSDTWTLLPLLQELSFRASRMACEPDSLLAKHGRLPIVTLSAYPTLAEADAMLTDVELLSGGRGAAQLHAIVSVVSSGDLIENLTALARARGADRAIQLTALVNTEPHETSVDSFVRIRDIQRYAVHRGQECRLCQNPRRRPLVVINPKRYSEQVEPDVHSQFLTAQTAEPDKAFWEVAHAQDAVQLHVDDNATGNHRHVWIDVPRLLADAHWRASTAAQMRKLAPVADLVLVPANHATASLRDLAQSVYGDPDLLELRLRDPSANLPETLRDRLAAKRSIMIMDDSVVGGTAVRQIHRLVQDTIKNLPDNLQPARDYTINVFVVLARPEHLSVWDGLVDSLRQERAVNIAARHTVLVPESCSWCAEDSALDTALRSPALMALDRAAASRVRTLLNVRKELISRRAASTWRGLQSSLFFCGRDGSMAARVADNLTAHSVFGEGLREPVAYAAVVSAMQRLRDSVGREEYARRGTVWHWNVTRIINAYHDPIIQAAFVRGTQIPELHVPLGRGVISSLKSAMMEGHNRDARQWSLVAAEHLLAVVENKYPASRHWQIREVCMRTIDQNGGDAAAVLPLLLSAQS
jgi:hypothetical protein